MLLASACSLACALVASHALAAGIAFTGDGNFGNIAGKPYWSGDAALTVPIDSEHFSVELNVGDRGADSVHDFDAGGSFVWTDPDFRIAATAVYNQIIALPQPFHINVSETQLGIGGEFYATPWLTLSAHGGGIDGKAGGGYVGGEIKAYVLPDASIGGRILYASVSNSGFTVHDTDYGAVAEWLLGEDYPEAIPTSFTAAYDHIDLSAFGVHARTDAWTVGIKVYLDSEGSAPLVVRNRTGTLDTIGPIQLRF